MARKYSVSFMPRTMGFFILLIIVLSLVAGTIRREMVLTLTGVILLAVWAYCLVMTLLLALIHSRRAGKVSVSLSPQRIVCGGWTYINYYEDNEPPLDLKIFQLPGILVRVRVLLCTKDKRRITYDFKPGSEEGEPLMFQANLRGAYFSGFDEFACFDVLGFFRFAFRITTESGARLLASPSAAAEPVPVHARGGETNRQDTPPIERTDILVEHRPYVPGDDPRRINWKLYSHGGELFIRQGEKQPPPHSNLTILIDTQFDELYKLNSARRGVDLLCENALAIINSAGKEMDVQIGFLGQGEKAGNVSTKAELGFSLAWPAAQATASETDLPSVHEDRAVLILALPRVMAVSTALDRFLSKNVNHQTELFFIFDADNNQHTSQERAQAAEICVNIYNKRPGVKARAVGVQ